MGPTTRTCKLFALGLALVPEPAFADTGPLSAYLRARVAAERGESGQAAAGYADALAASPDVPVAIRAYREALAAGDMPLATRAVQLLERAGVAPEDVTLLTAAEAARAGNAAALDASADKLARGRLVILSPVLRAWAAERRGSDPFPALDAAVDPVARKLATEARALLLIAAERPDEAMALIRALGSTEASLDLRVAAAQALGRGDLARTLFPPDQAEVADRLARARVESSAAFGVSRLFTRVAADLAGDDEPNSLAITLTRAALLAEPGNDRARLLLANLLAKDRAIDCALAELREIAPDAPFGPAAASARIAVLTGARRRPEALGLARDRATRTGADRDDWQTYADLLADSGSPAEAVPFYRRIAEGGGRAEWVVWMQLGGALEEAGDWSAARAALTRAVALAPDEPIALNYLGYARVTRGEERRAATALLERAHHLAPDNSSIADSLGWAYHLAGDTSRALPLIERAAEAEPGNAEIGEHLGDAYWTLGRRYEARYAWAAAQVAGAEKDRARLTAKLTRGL